MFDISATTIVWECAGSPSIDGAVPCDGRCWLCGTTIDHGVPWNKWQGANFTDQNKCSAPESNHVCQACVWCCAWNPPPGSPQPEPGKKGLNLRLFTHLFDEDGYLYLNKKNKAEIQSWLRSHHKSPWFAAISDSGQKHLLPWTPINVGSLREGTGVVYFEERSVALGDWRLVDDITALLYLRVSKSEIADGSWSSKNIMRCRRKIQSFDESWGQYRTSSWFTLALWLSQRANTL